MAMLCESINEETQQCLKWVEYVPQYMLPPLTMEEAVTMGLGFWFMMLVAWGITEIKFSFL